MTKHFSIRAFFWFVLFVSWTLPILAQDVDTAWVRIYDGPAHGHDFGHVITVDDRGNVYVAGASAQNPGGDYNFDYVIIKYDALGNQLWLRRYNGPQDDDDSPAAISVDDSGYVYVTGTSGTIKYDSEGNQLWAKSSYSVAMALDSSGHVYVLGESEDDYVTIKYDSSGNQLWVKTYDGSGNSSEAPRAIALDKSGSVYVTGSSGPTAERTYNDDYATIKYDSSGNELWVRRYNGPKNSHDRAWGMAVDDLGNVCVTGYSHAMMIDKAYATVKYDPLGKEVWAKRYNGPTIPNDDAARAIAVDPSGNIYVFGESEQDYATVKYDRSGTQLWARTYNGPGHSFDRARAIAVDCSGNVYVTGESYGDKTRGDCATIKYDPDGNQLWLARYNGPENGFDAPSAMAVDDSGNVYVTGHNDLSDQTSDCLTIKYVQTGQEKVVPREIEE
jgi:hypothetical protein